MLIFVLLEVIASASVARKGVISLPIRSDLKGETKATEYISPKLLVVFQFENDVTIKIDRNR